jgi:Lrp/AsnC family transcriptional regulator, leucine-responsive regulatory protein
MDTNERAVDALDRAIIELLEEDGRATLAEIGDRVTLSAPAVKRRIDRLQRDGVITGFTVLVDHSKLGRPLQAFTELQFAGDTAVDDIAAVARDIPEAEAVFTLAGDPDAVVHLRVRDTEHLTRTIDRLRRSGSVTGTKTLMVLGTWERVRRAADNRRRRAR